MATRIPNTKSKHHAGPEPLDSDQAQEGSPRRLSVRFVRRGTRLLDCDNLAGGCKAILDALRYEGVIINDDPGSIVLAFEQVKVPKAETGTEIYITELQPV